MQEFQSILKEALQADASELILETGKKIQLVKQNQVHALSAHGAIEKDWLHNILKTILGEEDFAKFAPGHPQRISYDMKDVGSIHVIARDNEGASLRFFFPPNGEQRCSQYWDTIGDESSDYSGFNKLSIFVPPPEDAQTVAETKEEASAVDPAMTIAPDFKPEDIKLADTATAQIQEIPFDLNSALAVESVESAPSTAPLPPLPPPTVPETIPEVEKIEDPGLILNAVGMPESSEAHVPTIEITQTPTIEISEVPTLDISTPSAAEPQIGIELEPSNVVDIGSVAAPEAPKTSTATAGGIHELLQKMQTLNASHLHLLSGHSPCFRVANQLNQDGQIFHEENIQSMLEPILPKNRNWKDLREVNFLFHDKNRDYRVHIFKDLNGTSVVFKSLSSEIRDLKEWNLPQRVNELCEFKHGLVILSGANDTLVNSLLAALVKHIGSFLPGRIVCLENEIQYLQNTKLALTSQREVGLHTRSFAEGLRSALQENPDLITLSNLSGKRSAQLALKASANTLVFAGIKAQSLAEARATLDSLLGDKTGVDSVLRDIVFVEGEDKGKVQASFWLPPAASPKAS